LLTTLLSGWLSYAALFGIVFSETGLLIGFFLPGDSLLFTVGVVAGAGHLNLVYVNLLLMAAAIIGDSTGYALGRGAGPHIFKRPNSRLFRREHLVRTQAFYEKHGGKTIIYARFYPDHPHICAVRRRHRSDELRAVLSFNVFGGIGWVFAMTMLGYGLGTVPIVRRHFEKVILGIILISVLPVIFEYFKNQRKPAREKQEVL
jgi:membrane-associated protein